MTYCVAMSLDEGMLFASDSRTNAGLDHVSSFCKMTVFEQPSQGFSHHVRLFLHQSLQRGGGGGKIA